MLRKFAAWVALGTLVAAGVPAGLAPAQPECGRSCCNGHGQCRMTGMPMSMGGHCHGAGSAAGDSSLCTCSVSPSSASLVPPIAFRFCFDLPAAAVAALSAARLRVQAPVAGSPMEGFSSPMDKPPQA
ncbi:MAG TPA: hypothetical protein VL523_07925 [Terriglobia bacterium]|nr:hypothetical protein [Terriglobia bacterium]